MRKAIKNNLELNGRDWLYFFLIVAGVFLFGLLILALVMNLDDDPGTYFPIATVMAAFGGVLASVIIDGVAFDFKYQLALSMGRARKSTIAAQALVSLARMFACAGAVWLLARLDDAIYHRFFYMYENELDIFAFFKWRYVALYAVMPIPLSLLIAAVKGKYGMRGWLALYFILLFACLVLPKAAKLVQSHPEYGFSAFCLAAVKSLTAVSDAGWVAIGAVAGAVISAVAVRMLMTMRVDLS